MFKFLKKYKKDNSIRNDKLESVNFIDSKEKYIEKFKNYIELVDKNYFEYKEKNFTKNEIARNIISVIVEHLNFKETISNLETKRRSEHDNSLIQDIYNKIYRELYFYYGLNIEKKEFLFEELNNLNTENPKPISIEVNDFPILLNTWNKARIIDNLININDENIFNWKLDSRNVKNHYLYPMGIIVCNRGNHSQFAARHKHQGLTCIKKIIDYSELYSKIYFNGYEFIAKETNRVISLNHDKELIFYSGVIFELGRYLLDEYGKIEDIQEFVVKNFKSNN